MILYSLLQLVWATSADCSILQIGTKPFYYLFYKSDIWFNISDILYNIWDIWYTISDILYKIDLLYVNKDI